MRRFGDLLVDCSDSCQPFGSGVVCLGFVVLVSMSCPCQVVLAVVALLHLEHLVHAAGREAPAVAVVAVAHPTGHSVLLLDRRWVASVPAGAKMRTAWELPAGPLGREEAIAGMACLFPCSTREALGKCASRLPCRRLLRC